MRPFHITSSNIERGRVPLITEFGKKPLTKSVKDRGSLDSACGRLTADLDYLRRRPAKRRQTKLTAVVKRGGVRRIRGKLEFGRDVDVCAAREERIR